MNAKSVIIFLAGCATGAVAAAMYLKPKYEQIAQEEIDSIKAEYADKDESKEATEEEEDEEQSSVKSTSSLEEYKNIVDSSNYVNYNDITTPKTKKTKKSTSKRNNDHIFYIDPDEMGDELDYDCIELVYYADGTLADICDVPVDDINFTVGADFVNHFGEFEQDVVHVKNEKTHAYYEITKDGRGFDEVVGK